jgi:hypothetical protein
LKLDSIFEKRSDKGNPGESAKDLSIVKMLTRQLTNLHLDPKIVDVKIRKSRRSKPKECFNNAYKAIIDSATPSKMKYVLGYAFYLNVPIEHAWVKDGDTYYDVTVSSDKFDCYISVGEFSLEDISEFVLKHKFPPTLYDMNRQK